MDARNVNPLVVTISHEKSRVDNMLHLLLLTRRGEGTEQTLSISHHVIDQPPSILLCPDVSCRDTNA